MHLEYCFLKKDFTFIQQTPRIFHVSGTVLEADNIVLSKTAIDFVLKEPHLTGEVIAHHTKHR